MDILELARKYNRCWGDSAQEEFAKTLTDEIKIELLDHVYNNTMLIKSIENEELRMSYINRIESNLGKTKVLQTLTDDGVKFKFLEMFDFEDEYIRRCFEEILESMNDNSYILKTLKLFVDKCNQIYAFEDRLRDFLISYGSDEIKVDCLRYLNDVANITKVILTINDDMLKLSAITNIEDDYFKKDVIKSFKIDEIKFEAIKLLKTDACIGELALELADVNLRFQCLTYMAGDYHYYMEKLIDSLQDDNLIFEAIKLLNDKHCVNYAANKLTDQKLIFEAIPYVDDSLIDRFNMVQKLESEELKFSCLKLLSFDRYRFEIAENFSDDKLKFEALPLISNNNFRKQLWDIIQDENLRFESIKYLGDKIVGAIEKLKDEEKRLICLSYLTSDYQKNLVLETITNEKLRFLGLKTLKTTDAKIELAKTLEEDKHKIVALFMMDDLNFLMGGIIRKINEENLREKVNYYEYKKDFDSFASLVWDTINASDLDCKEIMNMVFESGSFEFLYRVNNELLLTVFNEKQMRVLEEYAKIDSKEIRKIYSNYICTNYDRINLDNLNVIAQVLLKIKTSNSSEIQSLSDILALEAFNQENPLEYFSEIERIFVKSEMPYVGKIFKVFKIKHSEPTQYENFSPLLNRFKDSKISMQMMDMIIFNDLLKCAFGSNNRNLKNFLNNLEKGNYIFINVLNNNKVLDVLSDSEKNILIKFLNSIETIIYGYDNWKNNKTSMDAPGEILDKINYIKGKLNLINIKEDKILDMLVKKLCGVMGIDTFEKAKHYFEITISDVDKRNRERCNYPFVLEEGDFIKGINNSKYLGRILQNGSVAKEFLGFAADSDRTPLDTDLSRILPMHIKNKKPNDLGSIIDSTISRSFGNIWVVLKNDSDKLEITRDSDGVEKNKHLASKFSKLEVFKTLQDEHYGIRTGFPASSIDFIIAKEHVDKVCLEIAMNGFYIPVVDVNGKLVFTPNDYDFLRNKMCGLSYYDEGEYKFSDNLIAEEVMVIAKQIEQNNIETKKKKELVNAIIKEALLELGLSFKDEMDEDLSEGIVEVIDTGSTGRGTNKIGDGDFDFMMRLDKGILLNKDKLEKLKKILLIKFKKESTTEITSSGDFRLKNVNVGDNTIVDIDITFTGKTDKISYSTDMCLKERLANICKQDPEKYSLVLANILLAKKVLKQGNVYKPNRGDVAEGGLGGVGIENWILQNGGSFIDAVRSFLDASQNRTFDEFKTIYEIWDFGENHIAEKKGLYPHDNFVVNNMSEEGYKKMVAVLTEYINTCELEVQENRVL